MANDIHVIWNDAAIKLLPVSDPRVMAAAERLAAGAEIAMKFLCPVSPVGPLHESGNLRRSIHRFRQPDGSWIIGPTASYAEYVNNDTRPHIIRSHGPWSLHNAETGAYFGFEVRHPGTRGQHFIERAAETLNGRRVQL